MRKKRYFQWIAGEMIGEVATLESIEEFDGEIFYNFDDGETCNQRFISKMTNNVADLKQKFMVEIESPANPWTLETVKPKKYIDESMKGQDIDILSLHDILQGRGDTAEVKDSDIGSDKLVPPKNQQRIIDLPKPEDYPVKTPEVKPQVVETKQVVEEKKDVSVPVQQQQTETKAAINIPTVQSPSPSDPVRILVNTCKKHDTPVELSLNMKLPSKYIYNIAANEFENGVDNFIDCIVSDIDISMIIDQLKSALKMAYSEPESDEN